MKDSLKDTAIAQVRQDDASPRQALGEGKPRLLARRGCVAGNNCERVLQQVNERAKTGTPDAVRFPRALWQRKNDDSRGAAAAEEPRDDPR